MKIEALLCFCFIHVSSSSHSFTNESADDVYESLWQNNKDIANKTLRVDFLRQMENGSLQAERYINFTIQDINYVLKVTDMLKIMSKRVTKPKDLKDFMAARYSGYKDFANLMVNQYLFKGPPAIQQTQAMRKYLLYYGSLMLGDPLYFAVGLLPCSRLWVWLANNLNIPPTNAYYTWKTDNINGNPEKHYKALLNKYLNTTDKVAKANTVFRNQMQNEHDFFFTS
ncbi:uncharacterized protein LOC130421297 isoform X1 [Triplophysa dalaica]|uniref:uncharacterized protein LOC130421297 isoform X1 n=1 Tax=Triplophysa dalaica TaxID=1582913 RepID=UPI0024DFC264|nr:uncharacterized protein LOC130421297 isoform X1 [Triplophysa dalaica]